MFLTRTRNQHGRAHACPPEAAEQLELQTQTRHDASLFSFSSRHVVKACHPFFSKKKKRKHGGTPGKHKGKERASNSSLLFIMMSKSAALEPTRLQSLECFWDCIYGKRIRREPRRTSTVPWCDTNAAPDELFFFSPLCRCHAEVEGHHPAHDSRSPTVGSVVPMGASTCSACGR